MSDMQVTIWLGWETGMNPAAEFVCANVIFNDLANEVRWSIFSISNHDGLSNLVLDIKFMESGFYLDSISRLFSHHDYPKMKGKTYCNAFRRG